MNNPSKENYAILCNSISRPNILNFPYFFTLFWDCFNDFITVKKQQKYINEKKHFCAFIIGHSNAKDRIEFYKKLSLYKKVDSFGKYLNNIQKPPELIKKYALDKTKYRDLGGAENYDKYALNRELFRRYKFVICFENNFTDDYVTEKLPNVMLANSVGIYRGAPNVGEFFNTKSFINYDDYKSYDAMIEKIIELDQDDKKYREFLQEPFFTNNVLPPRIKNAKQDLCAFLHKIVTD